MSDHAKVSITLKAGGNTADPWIVVHADSVDEAATLLRQLRDENVFNGVKTLTAQFAGNAGTTEQAVETVKQRFPGAEVTQDDDPWAGTGAQARQELPANQGVRCNTCNGPTEFRSGTGKNSGKPYKAHFCTSSRDHKPQFV